MAEFERHRRDSVRQLSLTVANSPEITDELILDFEDKLGEGKKRTRPLARTLLADWFDIGNGASAGSKNYAGGSIPYVSSGDNYNGIVAFIQPSEAEIYDTPCVTVTAFGQAYIQPWRFCARGNGGSAVRVLLPKFGMSLSELNWFVGQINDQRWRFNYGRMATGGRLKRVRVSPPPTDLPISTSIEERLRNFRERLSELWELQPSSPSLRERFRTLSIRWKAEREPSSSVAQMAKHPAYKEIIRMGADAVPFIIEELEKEPDHWFAALNLLTGADPVPPKKRGKIKDMARAWIDWAYEQGHKS